MTRFLGAFAALLGAIVVTCGSARAAGTPTAEPPVAATATSTPMLTVTATLLPTATPFPPTRTPVPAAAPRPTATSTPAPPHRDHTVTRSRRRHHHHAKPQPAAESSPTATATDTPVPETKPKSSRHHRHHRQRAAKVKPRPTPSPTPPINLNTENTIIPVTCNGPARPYAARPFLLPPFHGWTSIVSYIDHESPNFSRDGVVMVATGLQASVDPDHHVSDFPAYWDPSVRQYIYYDGHNGYDYNVSYVPVYAAATGKVVFAAMEYPTMPTTGYGNMIMIEHRGGYVTLYGHLSKIMVHSGEHVHAGQQIAVSGNTGHSSGPHLHFTVFHNCTPTDPYGWTGPGPDPLQDFQHEASIYLWKQAPDIDNPLPGWPGMAALPPPPGERIVLLRLPGTSGGSKLFTAELRLEADRARVLLRGTGAHVQLDLLRGALLVTGPVTAERLYQLPDVVSLSSPGTVEGDKADVLAALARASLADRARRIALGKSKKWTGHLLTWQGHTILVGKGVRGGRVHIPVGSGHGGAVETVEADPRTGAYVIDLGKLTRAQRESLLRHLTTRQPAPKSAASAPVRQHSAASPSTSSPAVLPWALGGAGLALAVAVAGTLGRRRRRTSLVVSPGEPEAPGEE